MLLNHLFVLGPCCDAAPFSKGENRVTTDHEKTMKYVYWIDKGYSSTESSDELQPPLWIEVEEEQADLTGEEEATVA